MIEMVVAKLAVDASTRNYVVILQEKDGERVLPIWIGQPEAESIIVEMHQIAHSRPLTHDLCRSLIQTLGAQLERIDITRSEERTFSAEIHLVRACERLTVDARPSDSIAIALRLDARLGGAWWMQVSASYKPWGATVAGHAAERMIGVVGITRRWSSLSPL